MVSASKVNCGQYSFASLVHDIQSRCPSLDFLNERTMRLRYLDDHRQPKLASLQTAVENLNAL